MRTVTDGSGTHPLIQFPQTAPPTVGVQYGGGGLDQGVDPNYRDPQSNQWSVTVERQVERCDVAARELCGDAYVSVERDGGLEPDCGEHDSVCDDGGESVCGSAGDYQNWTTLYSTFNAGKANYSAFELEATQRMAHGLTSTRTIRLRRTRRTTRAMRRVRLRVR